MMTLHESKTVGQVVADDYRSAAVFSKYGIDFCCNGGISLSKACEKKNIDKDQLFREINDAVSNVSAEQIQYQSWPADLLADYIEKIHHRFVNTQIPVLNQYLAKLCRVHGERHPELYEIAGLFEASATALKDHMEKEEKILFPYIRQMVRALDNNDATERPVFGTVANPIHMMMHEHDTEGSRFREIAMLSNHYNAPADGCTTYRVAFEMLKAFEEDLHKHIHLENNILFPKAETLESNMNKKVFS